MPLIFASCYMFAAMPLMLLPHADATLRHCAMRFEVIAPRLLSCWRRIAAFIDDDDAATEQMPPPCRC